MQHPIQSAAAITHSFLDAVKPALEMETLLLRAGLLEGPGARDTYTFTVTRDDSQVFLALLASISGPRPSRSPLPRVRLRSPGGETFEVAPATALPPWISSKVQVGAGTPGQSRLHVHLRADGLRERRGVWTVELFDSRRPELAPDRLRDLFELARDERTLARRRLARPEKDELVARSCVYTLQVLARTSLRVQLQHALLRAPVEGSAGLSVVASRGGRPVLARVAVECTRPETFVDNWLVGTEIADRYLAAAAKEAAALQLGPLDQRLRALTLAGEARPKGRVRVGVSAEPVAGGPVAATDARPMAPAHAIAFTREHLTKPGTYNLRLVVEATASDGQVTTRELHPQLRVFVQPSRWSMDARPRVEGNRVRYQIGLRFTDDHDNVFLPRGGAEDVAITLSSDKVRATTGALMPDGTFAFEVVAPDLVQERILLQVSVRGQALTPEDEAEGWLPSPAEVAEAESVDACEPGTADPRRAVDPFDDGAEVRVTAEHPLDVRIPAGAASVTIFAEGRRTDAYYLVERLRACKTEIIGFGRGTQSFSLRKFPREEGDAVRISVLDLPRWIAEHGQKLPDGRLASPLTALEALMPKRQWLIVRGVTFSRFDPVRR